MAAVNSNKDTAILFGLFNNLVSIRHIKAPGKHTCDIFGIPEKVWTDAVFYKSEDRLRGHITQPELIIKSITDQINPAIEDEKKP